MPAAPRPLATATPAPRRPAGRPRSAAADVAYVLLIGYALLMFMPFAWSVITSFKTLPDSVQLTFIPDPFTLDGLADYVFNELDPSLPRLFLNSALIAGAVTLTNLVLGSIAGYAFARLRFPGREVLFLLVLATLMIPDQLRLVPIYLILNGAGPDARAIAAVRRRGPRPGDLRDEHLPDAPVLPVDPARARGGGQDRRRRLLHDVLAGDAAARRPGPRGGRDPPVPGHVERLLLAATSSSRSRTTGRCRWASASVPASRRLRHELAAADGGRRDGDHPDPVLYIFFQRYFVEGIAASRRQGLRQPPSAAQRRPASRALGDRAFARAATDFYFNSMRLVAGEPACGASPSSLADRRWSRWSRRSLAWRCCRSWRSRRPGVFRLAARIVRGEPGADLRDGLARARHAPRPPLARRRGVRWSRRPSCATNVVVGLAGRWPGRLGARDAGRLGPGRAWVLALACWPLLVDPARAGRVRSRRLRLAGAARRSRTRVRLAGARPRRWPSCVAISTVPFAALLDRDASALLGARRVPLRAAGRRPARARLAR